MKTDATRPHMLILYVFRGMMKWGITLSMMTYIYKKIPPKSRKLLGVDKIDLFLKRVRNCLALLQNRNMR